MYPRASDVVTSRGDPKVTKERSQRIALIGLYRMTRGTANVLRAVVSLEDRTSGAATPTRTARQKAPLEVQRSCVPEMSGPPNGFEAEWLYP